jgi:hypothetical protein
VAEVAAAVVVEEGEEEEELWDSAWGLCRYAVSGVLEAFVSITPQLDV